MSRDAQLWSRGDIETSAPHQEKKARFIGRPAAFDGPWILQDAETSLGEDPFGFLTVGASSGVTFRGRTFTVELPRLAAEDAEIPIRPILQEA